MILSIVYVGIWIELWKLDILVILNIIIRYLRYVKRSLVVMIRLAMYEQMQLYTSINLIVLSLD